MEEQKVVSDMKPWPGLINPCDVLSRFGSSVIQICSVPGSAVAHVMGT